MANVNNLKKGLALMIDEEIYLVVEFQHVKPGKGPAFVRTKLKKAKTGQVVDKTFRGGENVEDVFLEEKTIEYLYPDGKEYVFMDHSTYEQISIDGDALGEGAGFLKENTEIRGRFHGQELIQLSFPPTIQLEVIQTEPGLKGDTASGSAMKPAKLETGATIKVPLFINENDKIDITTEDFSYLRRI